MKIRKFLALCLAGSVLCGLLVACSPASAPTTPGNTGDTPSTSTSESTNGAPTPIRWYAKGNEPIDNARVIAKFNEMAQADGLNIELEMRYIPNDVWLDKLNVMLSTGESMDIFGVSENARGTAVYAGNGALMPITDIIKNETPDLYNLYPEYVWDAVSVKGEIYSVPSLWREFSTHGNEVGTITIRTDLLEELDIPLPNTVEELISTWEKFDEYFKSQGISAYLWDFNIEKSPVWLHRSYDTWPFVVDFNSGVVYVDENHEVKSWLETPEFKKDCEFYRDMYTRGWIHPDILSVPSSVKDSAGKTGEYLAGLGCFGYGKNVDYQNANLSARCNDYFTYQEKGSYMFMPVLDGNGIAAASKHPVEAVKLLEYIATDKEACQLLIYGEPGVDYQQLPNNRRDSLYDANGDPIKKYSGSRSQFGYKDHILMQKLDLDEYCEIYQTPADPLQISCVAGFMFDTTPVQTEYANVMAEYSSSIVPIKVGVVPYEEGFAPALERMKAAGLDTVVAEYKKQVEEFWASKQ